MDPEVCHLHGGAGRIPNDTFAGRCQVRLENAQLLQALSATGSLGSAHCQRCRLDHLLDLTRGGQYKAQCIGDTIDEATAAAATTDPCRQFDILFTPSHSHLFPSEP